MKDSKAPGLKRRKRKDGSTALYWVASAASRQAEGYKPATVRVHGDEAMVASRCQILTAELMQWVQKQGRAQKPQFDGTVASLAAIYRGTAESSYHTVKFNTRSMYDVSLGVLVKAVGTRRLVELNGLDFRRWYNKLKEPRGPGERERPRRAFQAMQLLRIIVKFGVVADVRECVRLNAILAEMEFSAPPPRTQRITFAQVQAFCAKAIEIGRPSLAQAQALQFELTLRQADVIGMWEKRPSTPSGVMDRGRRWSGGVAWNHIDANGVLRKETTKQLSKDKVHVAEHDTLAYPLLRQMLDLTPPEKRFGPIIIDEGSGLPYRHRHFSELWRSIADQVGIPREVWNRDSRAGGVTEGSDAGADIEHLRHHATHSNVATTGRYNRNTIEKTRKVAELRVAHRGQND